MRIKLLTVCFVFAALSAVGKLTGSTTFYKIDIKKDIGSTTWIYTQKGFEEAAEKQADAILIHMNTYGGEVLYADSIRTKILNADLPVYVFIDNNAASAGALIAIACDKIFMRPGSTIGAATVVSQMGEAMPDKYQSYMRATMRATAEAHGKDTIVHGRDTTYQWKRDPKIAEAMVDQGTVIPNLVDSGKTLTFTAIEAEQYGYCDGIAKNINEVISEYLKVADYEVISFRPSAMDNIKGFLMSSIFQGILIMLIIGGIYFELQTPGIGFPSIVAVTAALLYFAPLYIEGLAANWEILVFVIGLILLAVEIFAIPGFGITGILGIIFIVAGLTLSLVNNVNFDFEPVETGALGKALFTVIGGISLGFVLVLFLSNRIGKKGILHNIALNTNLENKEGYIGVPMESKSLVGQRAVAGTDLRPSGKIMVDGMSYDAVSEGGVFIAKSSTVQIVRYELGQVYVSKI